MNCFNCTLSHHRRPPVIFHMDDEGDLSLENTGRWSRRVRTSELIKGVRFIPPPALGEHPATRHSVWAARDRASFSRCPVPPLARPLVRSAGALGIRNSCYAKGKSPALMAGLERYETFHAEGRKEQLRRRTFRAKSIRRTGFACQKRKTPRRGHSPAGSLRTSRLPRERRP
jgi:hypothetical protein